MIDNEYKIEIHKIMDNAKMEDTSCSDKNSTIEIDGSQHDASPIEPIDFTKFQDDIRNMVNEGEANMADNFGKMFANMFSMFKPILETVEKTVKETDQQCMDTDGPNNQKDVNAEVAITDMVCKTFGQLLSEDEQLNVKVNVFVKNCLSEGNDLTTALILAKEYFDLPDGYKLKLKLTVDITIGDDIKI